MAKRNKKIDVQSISVNTAKQNGEDYICITNMAKARTDASRATDAIKNWMYTRTTLEF